MTHIDELSDVMTAGARAAASDPGDEDDDELYRDAQRDRQSVWLHPLAGVPFASARKTRSEREERYDRERDRDLAPPPPPDATACVSDDMDDVRRLLGAPSGQEHCFACRHVRGTLMVPVAADGIAQIRRLLSTSPAGGNKAALAIEIRDLYERSIRASANRNRQEGEDECPEWTAADIHEHYFTPNHGMTDSQRSLESRASMLDHMLHAFYHFDAWEKKTLPDGSVVKVPRAGAPERVMKMSDAVGRAYATKPSSLGLAAAEAANVNAASGTVDSRRRVFGANPSKRL